MSVSALIKLKKQKEREVERLEENIETLKKQIDGLDFQARTTCTHTFSNGRSAWQRGFFHDECSICGELSS